MPDGWAYFINLALCSGLLSSFLPRMAWFTGSHFTSWYDVFNSQSTAAARGAHQPRVPLLCSPEDQVVSVVPSSCHILCDPLLCGLAAEPAAVLNHFQPLSVCVGPKEHFEQLFALLQNLLA